MKRVCALVACALITTAVAGTIAGASAQSLIQSTPSVDAQGQPPQANIRDSQRYEEMVRGSLGYRQQRARVECAPIEAADLRQQCMESFGLGATSSGGSLTAPTTPRTN